MALGILVTAGVTYGVGSLVVGHPFCKPVGSEEETSTLTQPKVQDATCKEVFAAFLKGWGIGGLGFGAGMAAESVVTTTAMMSLPVAMTVMLVAGCMIVGGACADLGSSNCCEHEEDDYPTAVDFTTVEPSTNTLTGYGSSEDLELGSV